MGNLIEKTDQNGKTLYYEYDSLNRLTKVSDYFNSSSSSDWRYRKEITVTGSSYSAVSNYQIPIKVYYGSGTDGTEADGQTTMGKIYCDNDCNSDFSDIRFTSDDGETHLSYWIEEYSDSSYAIFWVKVLSISQSPSTESIFIYYGNPDATDNSDPQNTFHYFEDFEDDTTGQTPSGWSKDNGNTGDTFTVTSSYYVDGEKGGKLHEDGGNENAAFSGPEFTSLDGSVTHYWFRYETSGKRTIHGLKDENEDVTGQILCRDDAGDWRYGLYGSGFGTLSSWGNPSADTWYRMEIYQRASDSYLKYYKDRANGEGWYVPRRYDDAVQVFVRGKYSYPTDAYFDAFYVRKFVNPEPVVSSVGSVENMVNGTGAEIIGNIAEYSYDNMSRVVESNTNCSTILYTYDARGRVLIETFDINGSRYSVSYSYNNVSNVVSMVYPDSSTVSMRYDELNRLKEIDGYAGFDYTVLDQMDSIQYSNGVSTEYDYDTMNRPINLITRNGLGTLLNLTYGYDKSGSVTSINNGTHTETYTYDKVDRLSSTTGPWGTIDYTYDPVGNRLSKSMLGGSTITYAYDNMDRLTAATGMSFDWDDNGNMIYKNNGINAWNYTFDPLNRLTRVEKDGVLSALYTYDAGGRRVRSWDTVDGVTDYVYSGLSVIDEICGGVHEKHIYAGGMHIASNTTGTIEYYHVDHLGSTRLKTTANGSTIYESNYEPFGPSSGETGD